jgi:hypothetical protein
MKRWLAQVVALPELYKNTTFYLKNSRLTSLLNFVDCKSVRSIIIRMKAEVLMGGVEFDSEMAPLVMDTVSIPKLTSLRINIDAYEAVNRVEKCDARLIGREALGRMAGLLSSHQQLTQAFERQTPKPTDIAFRLVSADARHQDDVRGFKLALKILHADVD